MNLSQIKKILILFLIILLGAAIFYSIYKFISQQSQKSDNNQTVTAQVHNEPIVKINQKIWIPKMKTTWDWQLTPPINENVNVEVMDLELFDTTDATVASLHKKGKKVICYVSVGSWEDWRPDKDKFPKAVIGKDYQGWKGEKWLDIRNINAPGNKLAPIIRARFDMCQQKGFDGLEPDNIDAYENATGFPLTANDQLVYNKWLADEAHKRGLSIGLKNDSAQAKALVSYFDWALTEECYEDKWCDEMKPFTDAGKAVFMTEYTDRGTTLDKFCPTANKYNFNGLLKKRDLDSWSAVCPTTNGGPSGSIDELSLWDSGTKLRGANIYQRKVYSKIDSTSMGPNYAGPPYTQKDFDDLAKLGANYVEISHPGLYTETPPYQLDKKIQDNLDDLLAKITKANMYAVIAFRTGPGRSEFTFYSKDDKDDNDWFPASYRNEKVWSDKNAQQAWAEMWKYTANRYKDNKIVVGYKLMVEPNSDEMVLNIDDPDNFYPKYANTTYDWNQFFPKITTAIRTADKDTPVLVGGQGYSAVNWLPYLKPSTDKKTVYLVHQYAPMIYSHQSQPGTKYSYPGKFDANYDDEIDNFDKTWLNGLLSAVKTFKAKYNVSMYVGEYGTHRWSKGAEQYIDDEIAAFEGYGMNHAIWVWSSEFDKKYRYDDDDFTFTVGLNPKEHTLDSSNKLLKVITKYWGKNVVRPFSKGY